jgi:hypothetical protein
MKNRVLMMTAGLVVGLALWLPTWRSRRVAAQSPSLMGSYAFMATVPYIGPVTSQFTLAGPAAIVGVITFDGAGNVAGSQTFVQQDPSPTATNPRVQPQTFTGTYTVNADGTGTFTTGASTQTFVLTDGGAGAIFVLTAGGNSVLTGTARRQ